MRQCNKLYQIGGISVFALLLFFLSTEPIAQFTDYHDFADARGYGAFPNLLNVLSNLPFAYVGLMGINLCKAYDIKLLAWWLFFAGLILLTFSSGYYHLQPDNQSLIWDRLAIMLSLMSLLIILLKELYPAFNEKPALPVVIFIAFSSVFYWYYTEDIRFYAVMQIAPLVAIPLLSRFSSNSINQQHCVYYALICYIAAKIAELSDHPIYHYSGGLISGHTLKHLLAAAAVWWIFRMLQNIARTK